MEDPIRSRLPDFFFNFSVFTALKAIANTSSRFSHLHIGILRRRHRQHNATLYGITLDCCPIFGILARSPLVNDQQKSALLGARHCLHLLTAGVPHPSVDSNFFNDYNQQALSPHTNDSEYSMLPDPHSPTAASSLSSVYWDHFSHSTGTTNEAIHDAGEERS